MMALGKNDLAVKPSHPEPPRPIVFQLKPLPPFRLDLTVWALRRRPHNLVDRWDGRTYRRILMVYDQPVEVAVSQTGPPEAPLLRVETGTCPPFLECAALLTNYLFQMLGLKADLGPFYRLAEADKRLGPTVERWRGLKPPRFASVFEALVNAIACQQLSLDMGIHLLNRLATAYGPALGTAEEARWGFPRPADLAGLEPEALRALGFSRSKGIALIDLARGFLLGSPDLKNLGHLAREEAVRRLLALKGVGRWSAEYVLLRGLGDWSVFPGDDVGARRYLQTWLQEPGPLDYEDVRRHLAQWHPFAGLLYFHGLLNRLAGEGHLS